MDRVNVATSRYTYQSRHQKVDSFDWGVFSRAPCVRCAMDLHFARELVNRRYWSYRRRHKRRITSCM
jgi:hypothetical protein